ncbi:MAG: DJ-1/PfpI family protein [Gemmatimonadetes bacterium]|nr:DJ-1/PfpI family protein [Gemmatimonadota bacterium]
MTRDVAVLLFDEVEVLDFAGPFEVFSVTGRRTGLAPFNVYTVSERAGPVHARNDLRVVPTHSFASCPPPEILVVPGGFGTRREMHNAALIEWLRSTSETAELVLSVCTGALLLAKAGLLSGLGATTHHGALGLLREIAPDADVRSESRYVDNGKIVLSGGVSAGIDMALHVVSRLLGEEQARETAAYMEYPWPVSPS